MASNTQRPSEIDLEVESSTVFQRSSWIRRGKRWRNIPLHVVDARLREFALPDVWVKQLPSDDLSVEDFLKVKLPQVDSASFNFKQKSLWFSQDPPTRQPDASLFARLITRPVPPTEFLDALEDLARQAWLDGALSIRDPRINDGRDRFPLPTLTVWRELSRRSAVQVEWRRAVKWVDRESQEAKFAEAFPDAHALVGRCGWNTQFCVGGLSFNNSKLAQLLFYRMLCDDISYMFVHHLQARLRAEETLDSEHIIAQSRFHDVLHLAAKKSTYAERNLPSTLRQVEELVKNGRRYLWFIALQGKHETAHRIDFAEKTIAFGESYAAYKYDNRTGTDHYRHS